MIDILRYFPTLYRIKTFKSENINDIVNFAFANRLIEPMQLKGEIIPFLNLLQKYEIKKFLEIGTANGGTLFMILRAISAQAKIVSIDLHYNKIWGIIDSPLYKSFKKDRFQKIILLKSDTHLPNTKETVDSILDGNVDLLFIDGDHSYEGVKQDFKMYGSLVKNGGLIAFHDIVKHHDECKVHEFWSEIKHNYNYIEYIDNPNQGCCGIGVLLI
ncbi:MAG: class I SAM-dependent methyltransferase [Candidatus Methanoperedens sp.]|nr:class I SAM-dependent methyltransferase [Candidatus Methanoperedens sp.]MCE8428756.1 class I SAM-dependent methyltransferase [Candidatus Methanoperedens sp.]